METLRELFLVLGLDADEAGFATAQTAVDALEGALGLARDAVIALGHELVSSVTETAEYAGAVGDMATATGTGVEWLQAMEFAAVQSGSSLEDLGGALGLLNRNLFAATSGNKEAAKAFAQLGVATRNADGSLRGTEAVFADLSDAFKRLPAGPERTARAMEVFGRSGAKLLPLLVEGSDGLEKMREEARAFGVVIDAETLASTKAFGDRLSAFGMVIDSVKREVGSLLIEAIGPIVGELWDWVRANRALITQRVKQFVTAIKVVVNAAAKAVTWLVNSIDDFIVGAKLLAVVLGSYVLASLIAVNGGLLGLLVNFALNSAAMVAYGALSVATAAKAAIAWIAATWPVLALAAAFLLLYLAIDEVLVSLEDGDSLINRFGPKWTKTVDDFLKPRPGESWLASLFKEMARDLFDIQGAMDRFNKGQGWFQHTALGQLIKGVQWLMDNAERIKATLLDAATALTTGKWGTAVAALEASKSTQSWVENLTGPGLRAARQSVGVLSPTTNITVQAFPGETPTETADRIARKVDERFQLHLGEAFNASSGKWEPED